MYLIRFVLVTYRSNTRNKLSVTFSFVHSELPYTLYSHSALWSFLELSVAVFFICCQNVTYSVDRSFC